MCLGCVSHHQKWSWLLVYAWWPALFRQYLQSKLHHLLQWVLLNVSIQVSGCNVDEADVVSADEIERNWPRAR